MKRNIDGRRKVGQLLVLALSFVSSRDTPAQALQQGVRNQIDVFTSMLPPCDEDLWLHISHWARQDNEDPEGVTPLWLWFEKGPGEQSLL